jgi:hypothetical protein
VRHLLLGAFFMHALARAAEVRHLLLHRLFMDSLARAAEVRYRIRAC